MNTLDNIPTLGIKIETKTVRAEARQTEWKWVMGEPEFEMSKSAHKWYLIKIKTNNFIKRLVRKK